MEEEDPAELRIFLGAPSAVLIVGVIHWAHA